MSHRSFALHGDHDAQCFPMTTQNTPLDQYTERQAYYTVQVARADQQDERISNLRLGLFLLGLAQAAVLWYWHPVSWWTLLVPVSGFVVLVVLHSRVLRTRARAANAVDWYHQGVNRIHDRWVGKGNQGEDWQPAIHPYAYDLDCFGHGSLFELLCLARTRVGESRLAHWLLNPADLDEVHARQAAVEEWRDKVTLREDLSLLGGAVRGKLHPRVLLQWADNAAKQWPGWMILLSWGSPVLALGAIPFWNHGGLTVVLVCFILNITIMGINRKKFTASDYQADRMRHELAILAVVLKRIEAEPVQCEKLKRIQAKLKVNSIEASTSINKLDQLMRLLDLQRNQFFALVAILLVWEVHLTRRIDAWRVNYGPHLADWFEALGEAEALASLSAYAFEHPDDPFPTLEAGEPVLAGTALGHPLVPEKECVRNEIHLNRKEPALLVSGSNMSGKSTYLRTIGINVLLAQMGAPVRAKELRLSPLAIGATLRVQDSLQDGASRFYAEIQRFKTILDLCDGATPVLFLADEILHGTNSHDRVEGATGLIHALLDRGAIGLVTTHDLTLTRMDAVETGRVRNVHFKDHLDGDKLAFDYTLRDGVVAHSNALQLMRSIGLPV